MTPTKRIFEERLEHEFMVALTDLMRKFQDQPPIDQTAQIDEQDLEFIRSESTGPLMNPILFYNMTKAIRFDSLATMKELGEVLHMPKSTLSYAVDRWVDKGYAERVYEPGARRSYRVRMTPRGRRLTEIVLVYAESCVRNALSSLTEKERTTLTGLLAKAVCE